MPIETALVELPDLLRHYAVHLWCVHGIYRQPTINVRRLLKLSLLVLTRHFTGDPHYQELAELLTAADAAAGDKRALRRSPKVSLRTR